MTKLLKRRGGFSEDTRWRQLLFTLKIIYEMEKKGLDFTCGKSRDNESQCTWQRRMRGSSDTSGNEKSVSKDIAPGEDGISLVNSSKKCAATELYVDNKVETGKETSIPQKLTKTVTNNMQAETIPRHESSGENGSTIQESSQCFTEDSNKTSNLEVGAEIASKKNLSDNLTSTGQNTRMFGSGYIPAIIKIFGSSISSISQLQNK
ncbi:16316_t:CDS:2, partial [Acaulospora morrowiae]